MGLAVYYLDAWQCPKQWEGIPQATCAMSMAAAPERRTPCETSVKYLNSSMFLCHGSPCSTWSNPVIYKQQAEHVCQEYRKATCFSALRHAFDLCCAPCSGTLAALLNYISWFAVATPSSSQAAQAEDASRLADVFWIKHWRFCWLSMSLSRKILQAFNGAGIPARSARCCQPC